MKWKTFFQIILLVLIAGVVIKTALFESNRTRYQYIGPETVESRITLVDPNTKETKYEYVPTIQTGIIDVWTGKLYYDNDVFEDIIFEQDSIHGKKRAYRIEQPDMNFLNLDYKKLEKNISLKLEKQKQSQNDDLIKNYLQGRFK